MFGLVAFSFYRRRWRYDGIVVQLYFMMHIQRLKTSTLQLNQFKCAEIMCCIINRVIRVGRARNTPNAVDEGPDPEAVQTEAASRSFFK